jgi:hypothetical protein
MHLELDEEKERCLQYNEFQGLALLLPSPHHQLGCSEKEPGFSNHSYLYLFVRLA